MMGPTHSTGVRHEKGKTGIPQADSDKTWKIEGRNVRRYTKESIGKITLAAADTKHQNVSSGRLVDCIPFDVFHWPFFFLCPRRCLLENLASNEI